METAQDIISKNKAKRSFLMKEKKMEDKKIKYIRNLLSRVLLTIIFVLASVIYTNLNQKNEELYKKYVLENSLSFTKINNLYKEIFGGVDVVKPNKQDEAQVVFNSINYSEIEKYKNGVKLKVGINQVVNALQGGIVVFIGQKDDLGNTIIVQGNDGVDIWYSNISDSDIKVYDYVEAGKILGTSSQEDIYLTLYKDGKYISYEEYQNLN